MGKPRRKPRRKPWRPWRRKSLGNGRLSRARRISSHPRQPAAIGIGGRPSIGDSLIGRPLKSLDPKDGRPFLRHGLRHGLSAAASATAAVASRILPHGRDGFPAIFPTAATAHALPWRSGHPDHGPGTSGGACPQDSSLRPRPRPRPRLRPSPHRPRGSRMSRSTGDGCAESRSPPMSRQCPPTRNPHQATEVVRTENRGRHRATLPEAGGVVELTQSPTPNSEESLENRKTASEVSRGESPRRSLDSGAKRVSLG